MLISCFSLLKFTSITVDMHLHIPSDILWQFVKSGAVFSTCTQEQPQDVCLLACQDVKICRTSTQGHLQYIVYKAKGHNPM